MKSTERAEQRLREIEQQVQAAEAGADRDEVAILGLCSTITAEVEGVRRAIENSDAGAAALHMAEAERNAIELEMTAGVPDARQNGLGAAAVGPDGVSRLLRYGFDKQRGITRNTLKAMEKARKLQEIARDLLRENPDLSDNRIITITAVQYTEDTGESISERQVGRLLRTTETDFIRRLMHDNE